jgi:hypothetical protein
MKRGEGDAEALRRAANLVERDEPVETIEGGVLDPLGHHRSGELLQRHRKPQRRGAAELPGQRLFRLPK